MKAVLFDCDGTLVDSEYAHNFAFKLALQEIGHDLTTHEFSQFVGKSDLAVAKLIAAKIGEDCTDFLLQKKKTHYVRLCHAGLPAIEPTVEFLRKLAEAKSRLGIKIGVCSAAHKEDLLFHLRHLGIEEHLDIILSGEEDLLGYSDPEGVNKPKPYIYLHAMKMLGIFPTECVVIEDSVPGVMAGVSAGCLTVVVPNDFTRNQDLSHAHLRIESFEGISLDRFFQMVREINSRGC